MCRGREVGRNTDVFGLAVVCNPVYMCGGAPDAEASCMSDGSRGNQPLCT